MTNKLKKRNRSKTQSRESSVVESKSVFALFSQYKKQPFVFVESGGNFGDFLIFKGDQKLAYQAGIQFESMDHQTFMSKDVSDDTVIYIHGGGGFNQIWHENPVNEFAKAIQFHSGIVILGPQTFSTDKEFLKNRFAEILRNRKSKKIYVFCRDRISYEILRDILPGAVELELDHDTAFNLLPSDFDQSKVNAHYSLYAIREDNEAVNIPKTDLFSVWLDPIRYCCHFNQWISVHRKAKAIFTNRLHSAILGNMLNIPTVLLPNSYHKNRAVWEDSLKDRGVLWQDALKPSHLENLLCQSKLYRRLVHSYKLRTLVQRIQGVERTKTIT